MDKVMELITMTGKTGTTGHNPIIALKVIDRKDCKDMWGRVLANGLYVRPIFEDDPERDDGYYDINIEALNDWGAAREVINWISKKF